MRFNKNITGTKWESFESVLIRHALKNYNIKLTKQEASKFNSISEFDYDVRQGKLGGR